ncbi:hypothetical protein M404DRAFT_31319 [Pisolithus tinctorius Marx 270]|uniref:Zn(2)-C6 fungal-type domain-containing protein n=1 Tax=Pisolithus tinctorius Marx 270 TaxID=870435 RepID=A0A0C3INB4_PISTI|nr:hypothetical protein M404DRAFT_31319 [Pisolithus tinctorius Marx 270]
MRAKAQLEAERVEREKAKAKRAEQEAEEKRVHEEERHKAEARKGSEARARASSSEASGEVKKVVMDPGCTHCAQAKTICEFLMDGNKKQVACMWCNQSKGKCQWPSNGKDTEASPKTGKVNKGKKQKADEEDAEAGPSKQKWVKTSTRLIEVLDLNEPEASGSGLRESSTDRYSGLEDKLECLIDTAGLIANNLASLFELHETAVKTSGQIANALESLLDKLYGFRMMVSPSDSGSSELDSDELCEEANWLKNHGEDEEEEEAEGEDEGMAK